MNLPAAVQVEGRVLTVRRSGHYHVLSIAVPGIADVAKPGQFVTIAVGGENSSMLLRRAFSIASVDDRSAYGGVIEIVVSGDGPGTKWLVNRHRDDHLNLVGPLGKPYPLVVDMEPQTCHGWQRLYYKEAVALKLSWELQPIKKFMDN
jgi:dihydroorotate dehydrogenase electron transfer subunit